MAAKRIICDVGTLKMENLNPGMAYIAGSRVSTLGTNRVDSALYFIGTDVSEKRFRWLSTPVNSEDKHLKIKMRENWIEYILKQREKNKFTRCTEETYDKTIKQMKAIVNVDIESLIYNHFN